MVTAVAPVSRSLPSSPKSLGHEAIEVAESVGLELDPWQKDVLVDAGGVRKDGKWSAFEVGVDVARQNGKGAILEARELAGILAWGERLIVHSAHEFQTSMEAHLRMEDLLAANPEVSKLVKSVSRSHGSEGFVFKSGQRLRYRTRTKGGGRGFTGDTLILDEAMNLQESFIAALLPTLSGRSVSGNPQVWYTASAVDQQSMEHGIVFARLRLRGLKGEDPSLVWVEFSADLRDADGKLIPIDDLTLEQLQDRDGWARANPGLGIRISEEHIEKELRSMDPRTFAVERLGMGDWPDPEGVVGQVIPVALWLELVEENSIPLDPVAFAFDVSPDRSRGTIAAAGRRADGLFHVEVVASERGTDWIAPKLVELKRHRPKVVICDGVGPAASLVREIEGAGVKVKDTNTHEHVRACGLIFDMVGQARLRHLGQEPMTAAVKGAARRALGDAWAWSRKNSTVDITPLVASTLALWGTAEFKPPRRGAGVA